MEKLELNFKKLRDKNVLVGLNIIKVKSLIARSQVIGIIDACLDNYFNNESGVETYAYLGEIKMLYDILVLSACTNIKIEGIDPTEIYESNIIRKVKRSIKNYKDVWELILKAIDYKTQHNSLGLIADALPSDKRMGKTIKVMGEMIEDLKNNNPEVLQTIIDSAKLNANQQLEKGVVARKNTELKEKSKTAKNSKPQA